MDDKETRVARLLAMLEEKEEGRRAYKEAHERAVAEILELNRKARDRGAWFPGERTDHD